MPTRLMLPLRQNGAEPGLRKGSKKNMKEVKMTSSDKAIKRVKNVNQMERNFRSMSGLIYDDATFHPLGITFRTYKTK